MTAAYQDQRPRVLVIGTGVAGFAAAQVLAESGSVDISVVDMGENPGGRLAVRDLAGTGTRWDGHVVDVGAAYFTVSDAQFGAQVENWLAAGLVRQWFSSATVVDRHGQRTTSGPMRYAAPAGLRSLAGAAFAELKAQPHVNVRYSTQVASIACSATACHAVLSPRTLAREQGPANQVPGIGPSSGTEEYNAVILACPDPQALRVLAEDSAPALRAQLHASDWEPVISHTMVFREHAWEARDFWFVNDSEVLATIADDGARRGDGAAVLVAHSTPGFAYGHLTAPDAAAPTIEAEVQRVLGLTEAPAYRLTIRWGLARPGSGRGQTHGWDAHSHIAVCGDSWSERPRIEAAWLSGRAAARQVLAEALR